MYSVHDIVGLLIAVAAFGCTLLLPGIALSHITGLFLFRRLRGSWIYLLALVVGYGFLPVLDSLLFRFFGIATAIVVTLGLAAYGLWVVWQKQVPRPGRRSLAVCAVWFALLAWAWIDIDLGDRLYPSLLMIDVVKHAATVRALLDAGGAPPLDPFFLRSDPAGYYYYYYVLSALTERLCGGLIDSRAAVGGQIFWTGLGLFGLAILLFKNARFRRIRLNVPLLLGLMALAGLQIFPVILAGLSSGHWLGQIDWWSDQATSFPISVLWVPHHVASLIACWAGFLILANAIDRNRADAASMSRAALLAGIAFASAAGLSIWVALTGAICVAIWIATYLAHQRWLAVVAIAGSGALSAIILAPDLWDMLQHRAYAGPPITATVRAFLFTDNIFDEGFARYLARALMLPLNYFIEFGALLIGSYLFWRQRDLRGRGEVARLLTISAVAGLVVGSFLKSTIINNDLAWRGILFTQVSALLWTAAALSRYLDDHRFSMWRGVGLRHAIIAGTLLIGYAGVAYDLVALRAFRTTGLNGEARGSPQVDREIRTAYGWLGTNGSRQLVLQHNPDAARAFGYGLYGKSLVAVSDRQNARLFGAAEKDVAQRLDELIPVFSTVMPAKDAWVRLAHNHVSAAVVTANDPIWRDESSWVWKGVPLYASARVRVIVVPRP